MKITQLVTIDFETHYAVGFSLQALSVSEYVRDRERFSIHCMGMKVGNGPTKVYAPDDIVGALEDIDWSTHGLLSHNTAFDGFILSHHFGVVPFRYFDTFSMARGLHSNDISASLEEVSKFYGVGHKIPDVLRTIKGQTALDEETYAALADYCAKDVDLTLDIFKKMVVGYPKSELDLIDLTIRMFCDPVLMVDIPRAQAEYEREVTEQEDTLRAINPDLVEARRIVGSLAFADLLRDQGVEPPKKISPAWAKKPVGERNPDKKYTYAFAKDDDGMMELLEHPNKKVRQLAEARLAVKSTGNVNKAKRFVEAGKDGFPLPVGLSYYRAHTGRFGGANKMNLQNMERGGELRQSILAPEGHQILVCDSAQIECRVNGWLWGQTDLLEAFRASDRGEGKDAYCTFASLIYGRDITKSDKLERFVGKVAVLGLGFQMGPVKFQTTLAKGLMGPPVEFDNRMCQRVVRAYRARNAQIVEGWKKCTQIIENMAAGQEGSYKCLSWGKGYILLPNGMKLKYPGLKKVLNDTGYLEWNYYPKGGNPKKIYGGLLCENIVQALARIIVTDQMLDINKYVRVVMMTHDEVVAICPTEVAPVMYQMMLQDMQKPPVWCSDIPLAAEGGFAPNYSK